MEKTRIVKSKKTGKYYGQAYEDFEYPPGSGEVIWKWINVTNPHRTRSGAEEELQLNERRWEQWLKKQRDGEDR